VTELLLGLVCVLPAVGLVRASYSPGGVQINHVTLFSAGFLFYWAFPVALGRARVLSDDPALRFWYAYFDAAAGPRELGTFLACAALIYASFLVGSWLGGLAGPGPIGRSESVLPFAPRLLAFMLPLALAVTAAYAWQLRSELFTGYSRIAEVAGSPRGPLSAASLLLLVMLLLDRAARHGASADRRRWTYLFGLAYLAPALLLLSAGGRLYVASAGLIVLAFRTNYEKRLALRTALALTALAFVGAGVVGIVRSGGRLSLLGLAANIFAEPLFTSFSMLDFVGRGNFPLWNVPRFLLGDLVNLVPGVLLPGKAALLLRPEDYGYSSYAPVGAQSAFFSLMINFGVVGSLAVVGAMGFGLSLLRQFEAPLIRVVYAMLSGCLAFTFFRDPFSISVVKNMLQFSILVPVGTAVALHVATVAASPRAAANAAHPAPGGA